MKFESPQALAHHLLDEAITPDMTFEERMRVSILVSKRADELWREYTDTRTNSEDA
jgi:hypothetical protein